MFNGAVAKARMWWAEVKGELIDWLAKDEVYVYTIAGMIPEKRMEHSVEWEIDGEGNIRFSEIYRLDGRLVKQSQHIRLAKGLESMAEAQQI